MKHAATTAALAIAALCIVHTTKAETIPPRGEVDARVRVVPYNPDDVFKLHGYVGYQIHIQWAHGEELVSLGAGDAAGFDIGAEKNHFFIKPTQEKVSTNLTVLTNRRAYHFDYKVSKPPANRKTADDLVYSLRFVYPDDDTKHTAVDIERRQAEARLTNTRAPTNTDYWFCGNPTLKPISAHDDGIHTRLKFPARTDFPAIFVKNDDHSESLLNFSVEHDEVVIHRVARRLVLRRGQLVGCVVNQAFEGGGERPPSNTTAPTVHRNTLGATP